MSRPKARSPVRDGIIFDARVLKSLVHPGVFLVSHMRDIQKIQDYATVFRDPWSKVKFPGLSQKMWEVWQVWYSIDSL